jgi:Na+/proline symporter
MNNAWLAQVVFFLMLAATFGMAWLGRRHTGRADDGLADRSLNRWLVGLSAATTANSGFIVTAAVGLGYAYGMQWVMLPLAWFLGDLVFWRYFPARINAFGHRTQATTLTDVLTSELPKGATATAIARVSAIIIVVCLAGYTAGQWLAGQKFLAGAFGMSSYGALTLFALIIIAYSSIGGFRGSVYADTFQAAVRVVGTGLALGAVVWFALADLSAFKINLNAAGETFLSPFPQGFATGAGFVFGFAAAAIGFGLGQPQIFSRYLAGRDPAETRAAKWIYLSFVQLTWIAMTVFGLLLRGVMPGLSDPETGLSLFFERHFNALLVGVIAADVFATIASTSNGLLVAMSQAVTRDLIRTDRLPFGAVVFMTGLLTMVVSLVIHGSVVTFALSSVSLMGAGLAPSIMIKVMGWNHTERSLLVTIIVGLAAAIAWKYSGFGSFLNEAAVGIGTGLLSNFVAVRYLAR